MRTRTPIAAFFAVLCAATLAGQTPSAPSAPRQAQEPPPVTFRVEVNYVEVDASVTDAQGMPVTDLTADDFEVLEDGRRQTVTAFSPVDLSVERLPRPLFAPAPLEPDVQTNAAAEGRIYLIVLDDLHTSFTNTVRVRKALRDFIEKNFGANDMAAVVYTSGRSRDSQDFTSSRRLLLAAIDRFSGSKMRSEALQALERPNQSLREPRSGVPVDPLEQERAHHARTSLSAVGKLAEFMGGVRGRRKALLFVSEGISYEIDDVINNRSAGIIQQETRDAIAAATRANVAIYAIDPRGLYAFDEAIEAGGTPPEAEFSVIRGLQDRLRLSQQSLQVLAEETGGFAAVNRNDLSDAFGRIVRENSTYYVLGYYSTNERRDGRYRRLDVRVQRPGLQVRSRRGYVAPRGRAPEARSAARNAGPLASATNDALGSPLPIAGLPMEVTAAAFKGPAPNASVVLIAEVRAADFTFTEGNGTLNNRLEVAFTAIDVDGKVRGGDRQILTLTMKPDTVALARERGFRIVSQLDVPPGRYQLRVAAAEEGGRRAGSVLYDLDVPDFYKPALAMSGLTLTSATAARTPSVRSKSTLADVLPAPPTTARSFSRPDALALFVELYENVPDAPPHTLEFVTTLREEGGRIVFENREERSSSDLEGRAGGHGYTAEIPLADVAPGTYVLRVEGRSRAGAAIGREVLVRVQ